MSGWCFALVAPSGGMERQFQAIRELGIEQAVLTDNHDGAMLGAEYGFAAAVSLDSHPARIRAMAEAAGITLTTFCLVLQDVSPLLYE